MNAEAVEFGFHDYSAETLRIDPTEVAEHWDPGIAPIRKVWTLVLTVAVVDYLVARPTSKKFREAKEWIFYGDAGVANSFDNVVRFLERDPERVRKDIACRRSEVLADPESALRVLAELRRAIEVAA